VSFGSRMIHLWGLKMLNVAHRSFRFGADAETAKPRQGYKTDRRTPQHMCGSSDDKAQAYLG
jgi:hypothetical protein